VWHKNGAMTRPGAFRRRAPLDRQRLEELALRYVERYATTRKKLCVYLARKLRELGWNGSGEPDLEAIATRFGELGYVDDESYALARSQALIRRGYGKRRLEEQLHFAGIAEEEKRSARELADSQAVDAALHFAERRRFGPFATGTSDEREREKAIAAMVRAGHPYALSRAIIALCPGSEVDRAELCDRSGMTIS
jgi:regulatory protein